MILTNRVYGGIEMKKQIICNGCGNVIEKRTDYIEIKKQWGYFSRKDLECHKICLCEDCYDIFVKSLKVPVEITDVIEI